MGKYGHFSEDGLEFIITRPDTPQPWINYAVNGKYHALISNTGGGYSYYITPRDSRITRRRYNCLPEDRPGRYVYIRDNKTGEYYSPTWQPVLKELDSYECRHGLGYTKIFSSYKGIKSCINYFVPIDADMEIWKITLENTTDEDKDLSLFPYVEFVPGDALDDLIEQPNNSHFRYADYDPQEKVIYATNKLGVSFLPEEEQYKDEGCWGKYVFFTSTLDITAYDCNRDHFIGSPYRSEANPLRVEKGQLTNSMLNSGHVCGALQNNIIIKAGEKLKFCIMMGAVDRQDYKNQTCQIFKEWTPERVEKSLVDLKKYYEELFSTVQVNTPNDRVNRMLNIWNKLQVKVNFTVSRDASRFHGGLSYGMGFRDTSQDLLAMIMFDAPAAKEVIKELARQMFSDGTTYHNFFRVSNDGIKTGHSDDPLWLPLAVQYYLKETGDFDFLDEVEEYADGGSGTILKHCYRGIDQVWSKRSERNIPLMLNGDWNDDLNECGKHGKGESVMVAEQLCVDLKFMIEMLTYTKRDPQKVEEYKKIYEIVVEEMNKSCWDGKWYHRFTKDDGSVMGSYKNEQGQIYLNAQSWAVISGIAKDERAIQCLDSVLEHLDSKVGPRICAPAYIKSDATIGIATREAPGKKENASIFNHPVAWFIQANTIIKRGNIAFEQYYKTLPEVLSEDQDIFAVEPYVYCEYTTGPDHKEFGEGGHSWLTGTASWMLLCGLNFILGIKPKYDGLVVDPCIPSDWDEYEVVRKFRNSTYKISVKNPNHKESGISEVKLDGETFEGNKFPVFDDGKEHTIEIVM